MTVYCTRVAALRRHLGRCNLALRWGGHVSPGSRGSVRNNLQSWSKNLCWGSIWPRARGPMFPLARGLIHNQFQSSTTSPYVTIIQCWSGLHPWNGYGLSGGWLFVHPWRWDCSAVIGVSMVLVPLLFCLCPFCFYSCYCVNQITDIHQCICCLRVARHRSF